MGGPRAGDRLAELTEREAVTRALIAGSPYAIFAMDAERRLTEFNTAAEELSGYRREEVLGKEMPALLVPDRERARLLAHIRTFLDTGDRASSVSRCASPCCAPTAPNASWSSSPCR
jgi:PAS domain S-box-containing protein